MRDCSNEKRQAPATVSAASASQAVPENFCKLLVLLEARVESNPRLGVLQTLNELLLTLFLSTSVHLRHPFRPLLVRLSLRNARRNLSSK